MARKHSTAHWRRMARELLAQDLRRHPWDCRSPIGRWASAMLLEAAAKIESGEITGEKFLEVVDTGFEKSPWQFAVDAKGK